MSRWRGVLAPERVIKSEAVWQLDEKGRLKTVIEDWHLLEAWAHISDHLLDSLCGITSEPEAVIAARLRVRELRKALA